MLLKCQVITLNNLNAGIKCSLVGWPCSSEGKLPNAYFPTWSRKERGTGGVRRRQKAPLSAITAGPTLQSTPMMMLGPSTFHGKRVSYWNSCRILRLLLRRHALSMIATWGEGRGHIHSKSLAKSGDFLVTMTSFCSQRGKRVEKL